MYLSPINYQMGTAQNNSLNFRSEKAIAQKAKQQIETVVRNKRTYYAHDKQPLWQDLLDHFTHRYSTKKVNASKNVLSPKQENLETVYYDADNNVMATVIDINNGENAKGLRKYSILKTPERNYFDWGRTGHVDCYDEDQLIKINKQDRISEIIK